MNSNSRAKAQSYLRYSKGNLQKFKSLWSDLKESITGSERDYTKGNINKAILMLSIPMVLEVSLESVFAVVDIYFVGKISAEAVATVGITESLLTLVYAIGIGMSMATTALIARRTGEKDKEGAAAAAVQSIILGVVVSLLMAIPGIFYAKDILTLMGAESTIIEEYSIYASIVLGGNITVILLFIINAVFRSAGDASISMRMLWLANIANMILDPILIFGLGPIPALGIKGAAIASVSGRGLAVLFQLYLLSRGAGRTKIQRHHLRIDTTVLKKIVKLSIGGMGQYVIGTASWIALMKIMTEFGSDTVAGYTIAIRIFIFSLLPGWGLGNAAATLVGQNLGAKEPQRAEKSVIRTAIINSALLGVFAVLFITKGDVLVALFTDNANVIQVGEIALKTISIGCVFYGLGMVIPQAFNGAGDTTTPTWINFICYWMVQIPLAVYLAQVLEWNEYGVFYAIIIAESLMATISIILFKKGKWKQKLV